MFLKLYQTIEQQTIFIGIISIDTLPQNNIIDLLDGLDNENYSFYLTDLKTYIEYKAHQEAGTDSQFKDLPTQNITC